MNMDHSLTNRAGPPLHRRFRASPRHFFVPRVALQNTATERERNILSPTVTGYFRIPTSGIPAFMGTNAFTRGKVIRNRLRPSGARRCLPPTGASPARASVSTGMPRPNHILAGASSWTQTPAGLGSMQRGLTSAGTDHTSSQRHGEHSVGRAALPLTWPLALAALILALAVHHGVHQQTRQQPCSNVDQRIVEYLGDGLLANLEIGAIEIHV